MNFIHRSKWTYLMIIKWSYLNGSLTFITCLSKCRICAVFKHYILSFIVFYLFRMYEEGSGQMTCYWYVLISLKLLSIVCFWEEIIHCTLPTLRYIFSTKLKWDWTLNSVKLSQTIKRNIYRHVSWNDLKLLHGIYDSTHNLRENFYFAQCHGICGISWN